MDENKLVTVKELQATQSSNSMSERLYRSRRHTQPLSYDMSHDHTYGIHHWHDSHHEETYYWHEGHHEVIHHWYDSYHGTRVFDHKRIPHLSRGEYERYHHIGGEKDAL